jgi:hypothetical protein
MRERIQSAKYIPIIYTRTEEALSRSINPYGASSFRNAPRWNKSGLLVHYTNLARQSRKTMTTSSMMGFDQLCYKPTGSFCFPISHLIYFVQRDEQLTSNLTKLDSLNSESFLCTTRTIDLSTNNKNRAFCGCTYMEEGGCVEPRGSNQ